MSEDLTQQIADAAAAPAVVQTDSTRIEGQPLKDLIAADEYLARKRAAARRHRGIGLIKLVSPDANGR